MSREDTRAEKSPWKVLRADWRTLGRNLWDEIGEDNISVVAAGVAFYSVFAIIPGIAALLAIYGLISEPADVQQQLSEFQIVLPPQAMDIITEHLSRIAGSSSGQLSLGLVGAFLVSAWSANRGMKALLAAVNIAYDKEDRSFVKQNAVGLLFTLGAILAVCTALALLVILPAIAEFLGIGRSVQWLMTYLRWPALLLFLLSGLVVLYYFGPTRKPPHVRWVSPGAILGTALWLLGSWLFSVYVTRFSDYSEVYGPLSAVVVLLLWFFVSAYIILIGAELNALLEKRCR